MRVLICGATGCIGRALVLTLRAHGHTVVEGSRQGGHAADHMTVDYTAGWTPIAWMQRLIEAGGFDVVINAVGILMPRGEQTFARVHAQAPIALFRGAAAAGVQRIVQISALGVGSEHGALQTAYAQSKLKADLALLDLAADNDIDAVVVRPSLVYGPGSQSAALFQFLASLPIISLPGLGRQRVQPINVLELAEAVCRVVEHPGRLTRVLELAGPKVLTYREMLAVYRRAMGLANPLWLPIPMAAMKLGAKIASWLPQQVFSADTLTMLEHGNTTTRNAAREWLGRQPTSMVDALVPTSHTGHPRTATPLASNLLRFLMRGSIVTMWLVTALVTAWQPEGSGVMNLLARCGLHGPAGVAAMWTSCALNTALGLWLLLRPNAWCYALQIGAVVGYSATAAYCMPELLSDHCGPLLKNLPVLALLLNLWWTEPEVRRAAGRVTRTPRPSRLPPRSGMAKQTLT